MHTKLVSIKKLLISCLLFLLGAVAANIQAVYKTSSASDARKKVYFTDTKSDADIVIYYTRTKSKACWQNRSKSGKKGLSVR